MPPKRSESGKGKNAETKPKTPPAKKISSKKIVLPEDTLATDSGATTESIAERTSSAGETAKLANLAEPATQQPEPEQQSASADKQQTTQSVPAPAETPTEGEIGQDADNAALSLDGTGSAVLDAPAATEMAPETVDETLLAKDQGPAIAEIAVNDTQIAALEAEPATAPMFDPAAGLSGGDNEVLDPSRSATDAAISNDAAQISAADNGAESSAEQASIAAAIQQELSRQTQLKATHAELEWRLRQVNLLLHDPDT